MPSCSEHSLEGLQLEFCVLTIRLPCDYHTVTVWLPYGYRVIAICLWPRISGGFFWMW